MVRWAQELGPGVRKDEEGHGPAPPGLDFMNLRFGRKTFLDKIFYLISGLNFIQKNLYTICLC
jgi:hypothetical protein